jgi:hypothetical protein
MALKKEEKMNQLAKDGTPTMGNGYPINKCRGKSIYRLMDKITNNRYNAATHPKVEVEKMPAGAVYLINPERQKKKANQREERMRDWAIKASKRRQRCRNSN